MSSFVPYGGACVNKTVLNFLLQYFLNFLLACFSNFLSTRAKPAPPQPKKK